MSVSADNPMATLVNTFNDFIVVCKKGVPKLRRLTHPVNYETYFFEPVSSTTPVENLRGTLLPAGDTRAYPCIS